MLAETLALLLDGREIYKEITREEELLAKESNLVVVFGYSDDGVRFRGTIHDFVDCFGGIDVRLNESGLLINKCDCDRCPYFESEKMGAKIITAVWDKDGYSWVYETDIPHNTFTIMEGEYTYCRGIVFSMLDLERG